MREIKITVSGASGSGKSTIIMLIALTLCKMGCDVEVEEEGEVVKYNQQTIGIKKSKLSSDERYKKRLQWLFQESKPHIKIVEKYTIR